MPGVRDFFVFGGIGLAAYGAWLVYPPAGFMVGGFGAAAVGLWGMD